MLTQPDSCASDRGSVLLLFPAAVLVMFLLGAVVIDVSLTQLRARQLEAVAASAANDALAALDVAALRDGRGVVIDETVAAEVAARAIATGPLPLATVEAVWVEVDGAGRTVIAVTVSLAVDLVMAPSIGSFDRVTLRRTERATILGSELL
jgi:hypothetical protein